MSIALRPYQQTAIDQLRDGYRAGKRRLLYVAPTGSGKTVQFAFVTHGLFSKGKRTFILTHRHEILDQIHRTLTDVGVPHGTLTAGMPMPKTQVIVASIHTLARHLDKSPTPDFMVIDEFHHVRAATWQSVLDKFPSCQILGVTATPERLDGKGLRPFVDDMVLGPSTQWLIDEGFLARPRYFTPQETVDVSKVHRIAGDYNRSELERAMGKSTITGCAVKQYQKICPGVRAIAFCISIAHAQHVCETFRAAGISAECIDGTMSKDERSGILNRLRSGITRILVSVDLVSEGFDLPSVEAAILLRPTQSLALHLQQLGRSLRPKDHGEAAFILDHAGNCMRHGLAEEPREWSLDGNTAKRRTAERETKRCPECFAIFTGKQCPECGTEPAGKPRKIDTVDGELVELTEQAKRERTLERNREINKLRTYDDFRKFGASRGYKPGWAYMTWSRSWQKRSQQQPVLA